MRMQEKTISKQPLMYKRVLFTNFEYPPWFCKKHNVLKEYQKNTFQCPLMNTDTFSMPHCQIFPQFVTKYLLPRQKLDLPELLQNG